MSYPITPSPELVQQWRDLPEYTDGQQKVIMITLSREKLLDIATQAARWGADQELEACCAAEHTVYGKGKANWLHSLRRPKPPSLAEQALTEIQQMEGAMYSADLGCDFTATRAALERLQELEKDDE